jgi:hypothetical protein
MRFARLKGVLDLVRLCGAQAPTFPVLRLVFAGLLLVLVTTAIAISTSRFPASFPGGFAVDGTRFFHWNGVLAGGIIAVPDGADLPPTSGRPYWTTVKPGDWLAPNVEAEAAFGFPFRCVMARVADEQFGLFDRLRRAPIEPDGSRIIRDFDASGMGFSAAQIQVFVDGRIEMTDLLYYRGSERRPQDLQLVDTIVLGRDPGRLKSPGQMWEAWIVPTRVIWSGAVASLLSWMLAAALAWFGAGLWRGMARWNRGRCPGCGYDCAGTPASRCPECGRQLPRMDGRPAVGGARRVQAPRPGRGDETK